MNKQAFRTAYRSARSARVKGDVLRFPAGFFYTHADLTVDVCDWQCRGLTGTRDLLGNVRLPASYRRSVVKHHRQRALPLPLPR